MSDSSRVMICLFDSILLGVTDFARTELPRATEDTLVWFKKDVKVTYCGSSGAPH